MPAQPTKVTVRMYNVGFGDCFLLTFHYRAPLSDQHILIDFGSVGGSTDLKGIANDIREACGGKLYAVVATHRHKDHIGGFSDAGGKDSPGAIIASCKPEVVLQPWTENPDAAADATSAGLFSKKPAASDAKLFFASLSAMNAFAEAVLAQAPRWRGPGGKATSIEKLAANSTSNPDAVRNLLTMGKHPPRFLQYGSHSGLENASLLPGVKVTVLGPPSLKEQNLKRYAGNSDEYWISCKYWGLQARAAGLAGNLDVFPSQPRYDKKPYHTRWFTEHADAALKNSALGIVTVLDSFLNNTSLILLFEVKGKKLLFPGDAQLENWSWVLGQKGVKDLLKDVDLYKVGHHGSRNATPQELWNRFSKRKSKRKTGVLKTLISTSAGVYGRSEETKVPATRLMKALETDSDLSNTQKLKTKRGSIIIEL